jgi:hypothetical protein
LITADASSSKDASGLRVGLDCTGIPVCLIYLTSAVINPKLYRPLILSCFYLKPLRRVCSGSVPLPISSRNKGKCVVMIGKSGVSDPPQWDDYRWHLGYDVPHTCPYFGMKWADLPIIKSDGPRIAHPGMAYKAWRSASTVVGLTSQQKFINDGHNTASVETGDEQLLLACQADDGRCGPPGFVRPSLMRNSLNPLIFRYKSVR